jgi:hypothetical protein
MSVPFKINVADFEALQSALKETTANAESAINEVLHGPAVPIIEDSIRRLIPVSGKAWRGKKGAAKTSNSMQNVNENLAVTVKTTKPYQYLYFPNDGTNTRRHVGNQRFFEKGGEAVKNDIIERCIVNITSNINQ